MNEDLLRKYEISPTEEIQKWFNRYTLYRGARRILIGIAIILITTCALVLNIEYLESLFAKIALFFFLLTGVVWLYKGLQQIVKIKNKGFKAYRCQIIDKQAVEKCSGGAYYYEHFVYFMIVPNEKPRKFSVNMTQYKNIRIGEERTVIRIGNRFFLMKNT